MSIIMNAHISYGIDLIDSIMCFEIHSFTDIVESWKIDYEMFFSLEKPNGNYHAQTEQ